MIYSSSDPFYEAKVLHLFAYLLFHALPFALAYFQIWFFFHLGLLMQEKHPAAPRRVRFPAFVLLASICLFCVLEGFFTSFRIAAEFLNIYLTL